VLQLLHGSGGTTGDVSHLTSCPTTDSPQYQHFALIVGELVEKADQLVQPDHGERLGLDIVGRGQQLVNSGVEWVFPTPGTAPNLVDATRPCNGEHPSPEPPRVAPKSIDPASHLEEDITEDVFGVGNPADAEKPENLRSEPVIEGPPGRLIPGTGGTEMGAEVMVLHAWPDPMLIAGADRAA
jgi:hypothetical protein